MSEYVTANDGTPLDLDSLEMNLEFSGNNVISFSVQAASASTRILTTYKQTLTYTGSNATKFSKWEAQP